MRHTEQLPFGTPWIREEQAQALALISEVIDAHPQCATLVQQDLVGGVRQPGRGAPGLTGDQVLRIALAKHLTGDSYRTLAFRLADSVSYRAFCRLGVLEEVPRYQTLQQNVRKIRAATWTVLHQTIVQTALGHGLDDATRVRIDSTVVEADIHAPTDATLLADGVRMLTRCLRHAHQAGVGPRVRSRVQRAQHRALAIQDTRAADTVTRTRLYRELVAITREVLAMATPVLEAVQAKPALQPSAALVTPRHERLVTRLTSLCTLVPQVIAQTERRVFAGEPVPAAEKIVSLVEPHADILVKDRRDTHYGHKIFLSAGQSLVFDVAIVRGNPADATWTVPMAQRLTQQYGILPLALTYDGAFASQDNLTTLKADGVRDVVFAKHRGLDVAAMTDDPAIFRALRRFRAGIESVISRLKRAFGLTRARWRGAPGFVGYVRSAIVAANLLALAQHLLR